MTIPYRGTSPPIDDELLSAYLDGQVSPDERAAVEAAIAADPAVRERVTDLRATVALLRALPQPVPRRTFILTLEQAAEIRPVRVPLLTRLFPTVAAVSAVAAVLCLALVAGDLATDGFATKQRQATSARPAIESVSDAAVTRVTTGAAAFATAPATTAASGQAATTAPLPAATTLPAPAAAAANAPAPAATTASVRSASAPSQAGGAPTTAASGAISPPTGTAIPASGGSSANSAASQATTPTALPPTTPTVVANVQPPPVASAPSSGGTVVTKETHRVPVALVRIGEILLALLAIAGVTLAALGRRRKAQRAYR